MRRGRSKTFLRKIRKKGRIGEFSKGGGYRKKYVR